MARVKKIKRPKLLTKNGRVPYDFTPIPHYILDIKKKIRLSGNENRIWDYICRESIGWHWPTVPIIVTEMADEIGMDPKSAYKCLGKMVRERKMLIKKETNEGIEYGINFNVFQWEGVEELLPESVEKIEQEVEIIRQYCCDSDTTKCSKASIKSVFPTPKESIKERKEKRKKYSNSSFRMKGNTTPPPKIDFSKYSLEDLEWLMRDKYYRKMYGTQIEDELENRGSAYND